MAHLNDPSAWRRTLDPRDPESMDPLSEQEDRQLEDAQHAAWELDADFANY